MKLSVIKDQNGQSVPGFIEFTPIRDSEFTFLESYEWMASSGARHDISRALAAYAAFHDKPITQDSPVIVYEQERKGQAPLVKGRMAA